MNNSSGKYEIQLPKWRAWNLEFFIQIKRT